MPAARSTGRPKPPPPLASSPKQLNQSSRNATELPGRPAAVPKKRKPCQIEVIDISSDEEEVTLPAYEDALEARVRKLKADLAKSEAEKKRIQKERSALQETVEKLQASKARDNEDKDTKVISKLEEAPNEPSGSRSNTKKKSAAGTKRAQTDESSEDEEKADPSRSKGSVARAKKVAVRSKQQIVADSEASDAPSHPPQKRKGGNNGANVQHWYNGKCLPCRKKACYCAFTFPKNSKLKRRSSCDSCTEGKIKCLKEPLAAGQEERLPTDQEEELSDGERALRVTRARTSGQLKRAEARLEEMSREVAKHRDLIAQLVDNKKKRQERRKKRRVEQEEDFDLKTEMDVDL